MIRIGTRLQGAVATIEFENPSQRGALTPEMLRQLREELGRAEAMRPDVRVAVLRGSGETFSSGYAIDRIPDAEELPLKDDIELLCESIESSPLIFVASTRGLVVGAALDIVSACDFRIATRSCRFGITPAKLGLVYTVRGMARIHRLVGPQWARLLFLTGEFVDGERAASMGLVTQVVDDDTLDASTDAFTEVLASRAPLSLAGTKEIFRALESVEIAEAVDERLHGLRLTALRSPDAQEARAAFKERRTPSFVGWKQA